MAALPIGVRPINLEADAVIYVGGQNMQKFWDPRLISLTITDPEIGMNECLIELDDLESGSWQYGAKSGWLLLPLLGAEVRVNLGWPNEDSYNVYTGWVWDIECSGQRRSGRILNIVSKSGKGTGKVPQSQMWGQQAEKTSGGGGFTQGGGITMRTVLQEAAQHAGYKLNIDPKLASVEEAYWSQDNESFHQFGERIARAHKGIFKVAGDVAGVAAADGNTNALGEPVLGFDATVGKNVIAWRIKPFVTRPAYDKSSSGWFDRQYGILKKASHDITGSDAFEGMKATFTSLFTQAAESTAQSDAESKGINSNRNTAQGWVVIQGEPQIKSKSVLTLQGFRPGVDGKYHVAQVEHQYSRKTGFITRCDLREADNSKARQVPMWQVPGTPEVTPDNPRGPR